jgi:hypothetical protein
LLSTNPVAFMLSSDVVRNQVGLDADIIFAELNNSVLQGLKQATKNIVSIMFYFGDGDLSCNGSSSARSLCKDD